MKKINIISFLIFTVFLALCTKPSIKKTRIKPNQKERLKISKEKDLYDSMLKDFNLKREIYKFIKTEKEAPDLGLILTKMKDTIGKITKEKNRDLLNTYWILSKKYERILSKNYKKEDASNINIKQIDNVIDEYSHKRTVFEMRLGILKNKVNEENEMNFEYLNTLVGKTAESIKNFKTQKALLKVLVKTNSVWIPREHNSFKEYMEKKRNYLNYIENQFTIISNSM